MHTTLLKVALRHRALYLDIDPASVDMQSHLSAPVLAFVERLRENGFSVSEQLLHALCAVPVDNLADITRVFNDIMGVDLNWAPLVKGWNVPTGESHLDHLMTLLINIAGGDRAGFEGTRMPCGCFIPKNTFPLERYNGCPFCGTPFVTADFVYKGQASKLKELRLWTAKDTRLLLVSLLESHTPLSATQIDSLKLLLKVYGLPYSIEVPMKETAMIVVQQLLKDGRGAEAQSLMKSPADILRYLWFEKTGRVQIIEPKTLTQHARKLYAHMWGSLDRGVEASVAMKEKLKLKYGRKTCRAVASWLNSLPMTAQQAAELMNPKRGMWVRMIHALRLGEYSRKPGMEHLAEILDVFYKDEYSTWQGRVDSARKANDPDAVLALLSQRPGLFARCLFATMLRFGCSYVLEAFERIADRLPSRLLLSLANNAELYFDPSKTRIARPVTGVTTTIPANKLLVLYDRKYLATLSEKIMGIYTRSMLRRFAAQTTASQTIFIDPQLYNIPVSVGDRSGLIQDISCALMGTRFAVEGDAVRLFLQWGKGMHAQHLDMDLSCRIIWPSGKYEDCAYYNLEAVGAKHSGDIRAIPEMVGTAEYIELSLPELEEAGAKYVVFTCNAFSCGSLSPNLVFGWMDSAYPMQLSESTGVAYDPSCVQHMIRVGEDNLAKGIVCGVLDVNSREIIWLEMANTTQTLAQVKFEEVKALLERLEAKLSIGQLLDLKVQSQHLTVLDSPDVADEAYTYEWALNPADVTALLSQ